MTSLEEEYEAAAKKCPSYSACSGCMLSTPNPSEFDECYKDPLSCMELQANGMYKMREELRPFNSKEMERIKYRIRNEVNTSTGNEKEDLVDFLATTESLCSKPNLAKSTQQMCEETLKNKDYIDVTEYNLKQARNFTNKIRK